MCHVKKWGFFLCRTVFQCNFLLMVCGLCQSNTFWYLGTHFYCAAVRPNGSIIAASEAVLAHYLTLSEVCVHQYELFQEAKTAPLNCLILCYLTSLFSHNLSPYNNLVQLYHFSVNIMHSTTSFCRCRSWE